MPPARALPAIVAALALLTSGCGSATAGRAADGDGDAPTLRISAIPDQDPQQLARLYPVVADELSDALGVPVAYTPVTDYAASVTAFRTGDLDLVWFGGLTAVQARHQVPGARALAQRDVDTRFRSVFVAAPDSGIERLEDLRGRTLTFGSPSSTSGRLMPQHVLDEAGVALDELAGDPGFSGSHDRTIALVQAGAYDAGALNEQVWRDRVADGTVDRAAVDVFWRTPPYSDYRWVARPDLDARFGDGFTDRLRDALLAIDGATERQAEVLDLFGAERFVPVRPGDDREIEQTARALGLLDEAGA